VYERNHDFCYDYLAHGMFFHMALGRITPAELGEWIDDHWRTLPAASVRVCFTETHNTRTLNPLADGMRGSRISSMLLAGMVLCGYVPMLWHGQEEGQEPFIRALLTARVASDALRVGGAHFNAVLCDYREVFTVLRDYKNERVLGLLNVGPHKRTVFLSLPALMLPEGRYHLRDLLHDCRWEEEGRDTWTRDDLTHVALTLDAYGAYCLALEPVEGLGVKG
jgi:glycosidase